MEFPAPIVRKHNNVLVVRDDLFPYGSKARFLDDYFGTIHEREVVYGSSPRWGFAQISIAFLSKRHGKKATLFLPKANEISSYTQRAIDLGAIVNEVSMGFLTVCEAKARRYAEEHRAKLLPCGLDCPEAVEGVARIARELKLTPDEVWTVASSGVLSRGLQKAFPEAEVYAVQVGKALTWDSAGRANIIPAGIPFNRPAQKKPPFPSVQEYDAKAWQFIPKDGNKIRLFWNVGA